eukprot:scaffold815_cov40-Attheya_sp.AAC.1
MSFPPPLKEPLSSDEAQAQSPAVGETFGQMFPWHLSPPPEDTFPTFEQVADCNFVTGTHHVTYAHAGAEWRSSHCIKMLNDQRIRIVHLANDGYLYFNPDDLTFIQRHPNCNSGWKVFKTGLPVNMAKEKLRDFQEFAYAWFGTPEIRMSVLYNPESCRVDICFQTKDEAVGLEFSFEADWALPPLTPGVSLWWD